MSLSIAEQIEYDKVIDTLVYIQKAVTTNDELIGLKAEFCKKYYDSLIKQGFSSEQAIELVKSEVAAQRMK